MTTTRFLVTGAGGPAGSSLLRQLAARGHPVLGVDMVPLSLPGIPTFVVPPASDPAMLDVLRDLVAEHGIDVVIPTVSEELPSISAAAPYLGARVIVAAPDAVLLAHDKLATAQHLAGSGVAVPLFGLPSDFDGVAAASAALGSPFIAKPRVSRGGRGVVVVRTEADLAASRVSGGIAGWAGLDDSTILQAFAPGTEYAPVIHLDPAGRMEPKCVVLEKTGLANGEVGNATGVVEVRADDIAALALAAAQALGLAGPVDLDIRRTADGTPVVLEINARFGANSAAAPALLDALLATVDHQAPATASSGGRA